MAHVLSPKRTWIFILPLLVHGVAAAIGGLVWFLFSLHALLDETASARHIFRRPTPTEVAEGRVWFAATSEARTVARPEEARLAREASPRAGEEHLGGDPWDGCAVRRQYWMSGKNSGWRDGPSWSYGAYLLHGPEGQEVRVPFSALTSLSRTPIHPDDVLSLLPTESAPGKVQYLRECFPEKATLSVDGYVDSAHVLIRGIDDDAAARFESPSEQRSRARVRLVFQSFGLVAFGVPLLWIAAWIGFVRQPMVLQKHLSSVFPSDKSWLWKRALLGASVGLLASGIAVVTGRVSLLGVLLATLVFGVAGLFGEALASVVRTLEAGGALLLSGAKVGGSLDCREGRIVMPERFTTGQVSKREHAFAFLEAFDLSPKGAVGARRFSASSHPRVEVTDEAGRFFVETHTLEAIGPSVEERLDGGDLLLRGFEPSVFSADKKYLLRETIVDVEAPVTVLGQTTQEADPMAHGEDYREAGQSQVFGKPDRAARGPFLFMHARTALVAQVQKDLLTVAVLRILFAVWALSLPIPLVVALVFGRAD
jgi:hypothetical protein